MSVQEEIDSGPVVDCSWMAIERLDKKKAQQIGRFGLRSKVELL